MEFNLISIGLVVIALAWLIQLVYAFLGKIDIRPEFIICYMIGVGMIVLSYIKEGTWNSLSYFELGTFIAAFLVLMKRLARFTGK